MRLRIRFLWQLPFLLVLTYISTAAQAPEATAPALRQDEKIEVRISPTKHTIASGETLKVRVEIWNVGTKNIFVCRDFQTPAPPCSLQLIFENTARHQYGTGRGSAADCFITAERDSFATVLTTSWLLLPPAHFYGGLAEINTSGFTELPRPGRYIVRGDFSEGGMSGNNCGGLQPWADQIAHLPAKPWQGRVDTNSIAISVSPRKNH